MKKPQHHNLLLSAAVVATAFLVAPPAYVDASSRRAAPASIKIIGSSAISPRNHLGIKSPHRPLRSALIGNKIAAISALHLRGGDSADDGNDVPEEIDASLIDSTAAASGATDKTERTGGWGGLFGKKKSSDTYASAKTADDKLSGDTPDNKNDNDGSFEITMNTSPGGKSNVKVDIETPRAIKEMAKETLDEVENELATQKRPWAAQLISAGGASATTKSTNKEAAGSSTTSHISSKFPISKSELPGFLSMSFMMFLFIYVFTTVRDTKDTLVVSNCGAEAIPFLKLYAVMPCATAFIVVYSKLSNTLGKQALFYVTLIPFFIFYGVFAFVLFPNRDLIHFPPPEGAGGGGGVGNAAMNLLRYWSFSLFFIVSELWASAGVPLLFWGVREILLLNFDCG